MKKLLFLILFPLSVFAQSNNIDTIIQNFVEKRDVLYRLEGKYTFGFPLVKTSYTYPFTLTGSNTNITVDATAVTYKTTTDNLGASLFTITGSNNTQQFWYNTTGTTYNRTAAMDTSVSRLAVPLSRVYNMINTTGGIIASIDKLHTICLKNNIPESKMILSLEIIKPMVSTDILAAKHYRDAMAHCVAQGYGFKYWEVSNEPYLGSASIAVAATYAAHVKNVYDSCKSVYPNMLIGCQIDRKSSWSNQFLDALQGKSDFIAPHWYGMQTDMDAYDTEEAILADNYKWMDYMAYTNSAILSRAGRQIPQIDTEWRLLAAGTVKGVSFTGEWNPKVGNIVGTLHQATRLMFLLGNQYTLGASCWQLTGPLAGCLIPAGTVTEGSVSVNLDYRTSYLYYLYYLLRQKTGFYILNYTGTCPTYTGSARNNFDDGVSGTTEWTGPLTPSLVTKSADGKKIYIAVVNGSSTVTVPFTSTIAKYNIGGAEAVRICDTDIEQKYYQDFNHRFYSEPPVTISGNQISCSLPPLSFTIITVTSNQTLTNVSNFASAQNGSTGINLSWTNVTGNNGYNVQYRLAFDTVWTALSNPAQNATTASLTGLISASPYKIRIRPIGSTSLTGNWTYVNQTTGGSATAINFSSLTNATYEDNVLTATSAGGYGSAGALRFTGDGFIQMSLDAATCRNIYLGVNTYGSMAGYWSFHCGISVNSSGWLTILNNTARSTSGVIVPNSANFLVRLTRTGSRFLGAYSDDGGTNWYGFGLISYTYSNTMYVYFLIDTNNNTIYNPISNNTQ